MRLEYKWHNGSEYEMGGNRMVVLPDAADRDVTLALAVVDRLRAARPDLALSSDFIVGFPGESDADFDDTMRLIADVGFASAFSFKYSRRPGTPGSSMPDQ